MDEVWKSVIYQGKHFDMFEVSNRGNFRNTKTKKQYRLYNNKQGYNQICVSLGSRQNKKVFKIHKAVAETFIENPKNKPFVNHIDGVKTNNNIANLEWVTAKENTIHAVEHGLIIAKQGEEASSTKLTEEQVKYIRNNYIPRDKELGSHALGRRFNVAHSTISRIIHNKNWVNVV